MDREKAIKILVRFKNNEMQRDKLEKDNRCGGWKIGDIYKHLELNTAIETLIQIVENSISREVIEKKLTELKKEYKEALETNSTKVFILKCQIEILQELLEK